MIDVENEKEKDVVRPKLRITFRAKKGEIFTVASFLEKSGMRAVYCDGVDDPEEIKKRERMMNRHAHEIIKMLRVSRKISFIGTDRFKRNGIRGHPPKVYRLETDLEFNWSG